jgi:AraC family transcriptional regulator
MCGNFVLSDFSDVSPSSRSVIFPRLGPSLHSMLTSAGYEIRQNAGYDWDGLRRGKESFVLFQYTLGGRGLLEYEGRRYEVLPGSAMLLYFPHENRYWLPSGGRWKFFFLCLHGSEILRIWKNLIGRYGPLITLSPESAELKTASAICLKILRNEVRSPWRASSLAYDLGMTLLENLHRDLPSTASHHRPASIQNAMVYCRDHLALPIGVEEMAQAAGYSRFHFTRLFLKSEGVSPMEYLTRRRMQLAVQLLKTTTDPVKLIARRCGYKSSGYFGKVFLKTYGLSPGDFRKTGMY